MAQAFQIYVKDPKDFQLLYPMTFNHYWNIRYDNGEDLFGENENNIFCSKMYFDASWQIDLEDFRDFISRICAYLPDAFIIGYYELDLTMVSVCKVPQMENYTIESKEVIIQEVDLNDYRQFFSIFHIELKEYYLNKIEGVVKG